MEPNESLLHTGKLQIFFTVLNFFLFQHLLSRTCRKQLP